MTVLLLVGGGIVSLFVLALLALKIMLNPSHRFPWKYMKENKKPRLPR